MTDSTPSNTAQSETNPIITVTAVIQESPYQVSLSDGEHQWLGDEPLSAGGLNTGPSPTSLLLSSLGACTSITLKMYASRKAWPLEEVLVKLAFNPEGKPENGNQITRQITLIGELDETQRKRLLQVANACPIHKVLTGQIEIATDLV